MENKIKGSIGIDLEDYYHVSAFDNVLSNKQKKDLPSLIEPATDLLLGIFDQYNIKATFFCLGIVARNYPELIRKIYSSGHEIAAHSMYHERINKMDKNSFEADAKGIKSLLEDITGDNISGYRAPSFSIDESVYDLFYNTLQENGYKYSSSLNPIKHDYYGDPKAPRFAFYPEGYNILEIPVSTADILSKRIAIGGGGWFRLMPYIIYKFLAKRLNKQKQPLIFYTHPWEFMPDQPIINGLSFKARFRHYVNLKHTEGKFRKLCRDFSWDRMDAIYEQI